MVTLALSRDMTTKLSKQSAAQPEYVGSKCPKDVNGMHFFYMKEFWNYEEHCKYTAVSCFYCGYQIKKVK